MTGDSSGSSLGWVIGGAGGGEEGGGAIYVPSDSELVVVGCTFLRNYGSTGGAINNLLSALTVVNSSFVDNVSDLGFSINNANKDLGYFLKMVEDLNTRAQIAEGTSANLQAAVDAGMGNGNVPEILDYFLKLEK